MSRHCWARAELFNPLIAQLIHRQRDQDPTSKLGVGTGWSGSKLLFSSADPAVRQLARWVTSILPPGAWEVSAWGNVMERGDRVAPHDHNLSHLGGLNKLAGCYYVTTGSRIVFDGLGGYEAQPGLCLLFPADAIHYVELHQTEEPRISVAFNVRQGVGGSDF